MADVIHGAVRTLPGSFHKLPAGQTCDNHPQRPAVCRIQGATDSMGCELEDLCEECRGIFLNQVSQFGSGTCDLCRRFKDTLQKWRDPEEGLAGAVYDACEECRQERTSGGEHERPQDEAQVAQMMEEFDPVIDPDAEDHEELPEDLQDYPDDDAQ